MRTHIGYGSPHKHDTFAAHGSPLGEEEVRLTKLNLGWPKEPQFYVPEPVLAHFRRAVEQGREAEQAWQAMLADYAAAYPAVAEEFQRVSHDVLPDGWDAEIMSFSLSMRG